MTRATISKWTNHWKDVIGYTVGKFARSDKSRHTCSQSRLRSIAKSRHKNSIQANAAQSAQDSAESGSQRGIYSPHVVQYLFFRTLKQASDRIAPSSWRQVTRDAWKAELKPIAEFYSQLCAGENTNKSGKTPLARNLFERRESGG